jgi:hypothetical protein
MIATMTALILALVLVASQADAACAWVLWEHRATTVVSPKLDHKDSWLVSEASDSKPNCEDALGKRIKILHEQIKKMGLLVAPGPKGYMMVLKRADGTPESTSLIDYQCLPDTIDPRGPKGGGR